MCRSKKCLSRTPGPQRRYELATEPFSFVAFCIVHTRALLLLVHPYPNHTSKSTKDWKFSCLETGCRSRKYFSYLANKIILCWKVKLFQSELVIVATGRKKDFSTFLQWQQRRFSRKRLTSEGESNRVGAAMICKRQCVLSVSTFFHLNFSISLGLPMFPFSDILVSISNAILAFFTWQLPSSTQLSIRSQIQSKDLTYLMGLHKSRLFYNVY